METLKSKARYFAVAGFLFCGPLFAQSGTNRTIAVSGTAVTVPFGTGYTFTVSGTGTLSGVDGTATFLASGSLPSLAGVTGSQPVNGVATMVYPNGDALLMRLTVPAGYIIPGLEQPTTNNATLTVTGGTGGFVNASGAFLTLPLTVSINGPNSAAISATGSAALSTPALRVPGSLTFSGSMAHLASGGGWKTTITLLNSGTVPAQTQLRFYDDAGAPLALPLAFPQAGTAPSTSATFSQTLAAGAILVIDSQGPDATLLTGSAQFSTDGNVSAYIIFKYVPTGQEAAVPLQTANSGMYAIPFDNTGGLATGIAVSNVAGSTASVAFSVKDDAGVGIASGTIPLAAFGHSSFVIGERYAAAVGKRGVIEFTTPTGGQISAIGIRGSSTGAYTTIPAIPLTARQP